MFFFQCLQIIINKEVVDPSNQSLLLNDNNKEKYLDGSNNSFIFESDVEPLLQKPIDISNEIQNIEKKSKKNFFKILKKNIFTSCYASKKNELKQSISEANRLLSEVQSEVIPTMLDHVATVTDTIINQTEDIPTVLDHVATVTDTIINQTEVIPTVLDNVVATVTDTIINQTEVIPTVLDNVVAVTDTDNH